MNEPIKIQPVKIPKNGAAFVYLNCALSATQKEALAADFTAKLGCKAVVLDVGQRVCFVSNNAPEALLALIDSCEASDRMKNALREWLAYKRYKYEIIGFRKLLTITAKKVRDYGEQTICDLIDECMANMWDGIIWAKLKPAAPAKAKRTYEEE